MKNNDNILKLFEGLTKEQAQELRQRIVPALEQVRAEIVATKPTDRSTTMSTQHLKDHLEKVRQDNQKRIDRLTSQIEARKSKGLDHADLEKELSQVKTTAARSEELAERRLAEAEKAAQDKANAENSKRAKNAAEVDAKRKRAALRLWIAQGGEPDEFENAWTGIRAELLKSAVVQGTADRENRTTIVGRSL